MALLRGVSSVIVVLSKGAAGATAYLASGEFVHQNVPKVCVVDTLAASDCLNAGLLAKLIELDLISKNSLTLITSAQLPESMAYAMQAAAISFFIQGAKPP